MPDKDFFKEIEHVEVAWGERSIWVPVFYPDSTSMGAMYLASSEKLKAWMPSPRMFPLRITPGKGLVSVSVMEFRDSDLGPYNEVGIGVPFTLDKPSPSFTGTLRKGPAEPYLYIHHMPVTTEIARAAGADFAGYPKFVATIEFKREAGWVSGRLADGDQHILTLTGRELGLQDIAQSRLHAFTSRNGRLLRSEVIYSERRLGRSKNAADVRLELGNHAISQELADLGIGRLVAYQYVPEYQSILTPVIESLAL